MYNGFIYCHIMKMHSLQKRMHTTQRMCSQVIGIAPCAQHSAKTRDSEGATEYLR